MESSQEALLGGAEVKNLPPRAGDARDLGSTPGSGRSLGGGHGKPLQYSCLENTMDRGAWWAKSPQGCKESDMTEVTQHAHAVILGPEVRQRWLRAEPQSTHRQ